jgi:5-formyltetrahydrofolate cyclo-ligase
MTIERKTDMTKESIDRINELARKSKAEGLTEEEKVEQAALRKEYLADIRKSLEATLSNVYFVEEDGSQTPLKKKDETLS